MDDAKEVWSLWQSLLKGFQRQFTRGGWVRDLDRRGRDSRHTSRSARGRLGLRDEGTPEAEPIASPIPTSAFALPTQLPTLTPFPSATPRPTAERAQTPAGDQDAVPEEDGSFLDLEGEFSLDQIKSGLCMGGSITLGFFGALAAYLLLRNTLRLLLSRMRSWFSR